MHSKQRRNKTAIADTNTIELEAAPSIEAILAALAADESPSEQANNTKKSKKKKKNKKKGKKQQAQTDRAEGETIVESEDEHVSSEHATVRETSNATEEEDCCSICLEDFGPVNCLRVLDCWHQFHVECLEMWCARNSVCPMCNVKI